MLAAASLAACQAAGGEPSAEGGLVGSSVGGPFSLTDQDGKRVSDTDFAGRYRIVYFGFANCPDVCPVDLQVIGAGLKRFEADDQERAAKVQPIFITVDPARDTPQVLKEYVRNFHPRLVGLTGSEAEIEAAKKEFAVYGSKMDPEAPGGGYNVNHSRIIFLLGPDGQPIEMVPHDQGPEGVAAVLDRFVQ
jgi:protein SCO1/2